jgi:hypothetical protein
MILSSHGIIGSQIVQINTLLDLYPNAAAAYSLRLLRQEYTGSAIEVRRASDNSTQDIGFVNNELDVATLESFCSGTNGFVTTWYDQSGSIPINNATQITAINQPQIVSSGSVFLENGKPTIKPIDAVPILPTLIKGSRNLNSFTVNKTRNDTSLQRIISTFSGAGPVGGELLLDTSNARVRLLALGQNLTIADTNLYRLIYTQLIGGSSINLAINGGSLGTMSTTGNVDTTNNINLFEDVGGTSPEICDNMQEVIIYNVDQSSNRTGIETNINTYYGIY